MVYRAFTAHLALEENVIHNMLAYMNTKKGRLIKFGIRSQDIFKVKVILMPIRREKKRD